MLVETLSRGAINATVIPQHQTDQRI